MCVFLFFSFSLFQKATTKVFIYDGQIGLLLDYNSNIKYFEKIFYKL